MSTRIALYEPDIPQNTGAILRLAACFSLAIDIIEPCGFTWDNKRLKRSGMDYLDQVSVNFFSSWKDYLKRRNKKSRLILLTTHGTISYSMFEFEAGDTLLLGRESSGVPDYVHRIADASIVIPMKLGMRSLNVAMSASIVVSESLRQLNFFP